MTNETNTTKKSAAIDGPINPDTMREIDLRMSNLDHEVDDGMAEALMADPGKVFGRHSAWDFNGKVYFNEGKFHEQVWVYGSPRKTISAGTLEDLMNEVNSEYGDD